MQFQPKAKPDVKFFLFFFGYLNEFAISDKKKSLI